MTAMDPAAHENHLELPVAGPSRLSGDVKDKVLARLSRDFSDGEYGLYDVGMID